MDKNTIIGMLLIAGILIAYTIYTKPSKEQIAEQKRLRDSVEMVAKQKEIEEAQLQNVTDTQQSQLNAQTNVADFFSTGKPVVTTDSATIENDPTTNIVTEIEASPTDSLTSLEESRLIVLENEKVKLLLNTRGGGIHSVELKGEKRYDNDSLYIFDNKNEEASFNLELANRNSVTLNTRDHIFKPIKTDNDSTIIMRLENSPEQYIDFIYTLPSNEYMMDFDIRVVGMSTGLHPNYMSNFKLHWDQKLRQQEKGRNFENRFARIHYKYDGQSVEKLSEMKNAEKEMSEPVKWFAFKDQFFSSVIIAEKPFTNIILKSKLLNETNYIKEYAADAMVPVFVDAQNDALHANFSYYFGPNHYYTLKDYNKNVSASNEKLDLHEIVYLGYRWLSWVNKYFSIPVFNFFLSLNWNMGLIILIMTLLVKLIVLPLTYKGFKSTAKMRVLRPQIKEIEEKYPGNDNETMMKRQQATMELYNRAGASPMSGCLPMLLQMPILLAFFFFFPSAIELRQQSFLWANDLSTYDSIISWSGNIPFITKFLGNHISLFCLLMTVVNIVYTKYNMSNADTGQAQMPGMKYMPILMPIMMFFFLNSYPAGLNYYYFLSALIAIITNSLFKVFLNEEKLLLQLEENKKKPRKKSGFMARLEEAQKMQEKQLRERAKENAKKNRR